MKLLAFGLVVLGYLQLQSFAALDLQVQVTALYEFRMMLIDNRGVLDDWNEKQVNPCVYNYIMCDQDNNVYAITLSTSGLSGVLSPSIGKLTSLHQLFLDGNLISGEIPQELGKLTSLRSLQLGNNLLNGLIPESFRNLSELQLINLRSNRLSGKIPNFFGRLQGLQNLDLSQNHLSGEIPMSFSNLTSLKDISLAYNSLSGGIPLQMFQVAKYKFLGNHLNCSQNSTPCEGSNIKSGKKTKRWIIVIATVVSLVLAFLCFMFCFRWIRRHRKVKLNLWYISKVNERQDEELVWGIEGKKSGFTLFSLSQLLEATSNFSDKNKLGQGGFGPVYKGQFPDRLEVAVKRLASRSGQGFTEYKN